MKDEDGDYAIYSPLRTQQLPHYNNYPNIKHRYPSSSSDNYAYPPRQSSSPENGIHQQPPFTIKKEEGSLTKEDIKPEVPAATTPPVMTKPAVEQRWEVTLYDLPATGTIPEFSSDYLGSDFCPDGYRCCIKMMPRRMVLSFTDRQKAMELLRHVRKVQWRGHQLHHSGPPEKVCVPVVQF